MEVFLLIGHIGLFLSYSITITFFKNRFQYVNQISMAEGENIENLAPDISFYERFVFKVLNFNLNGFNYLFQPYNFTLSEVYFPWNRTFEIGLDLTGI